MGIFDIFKKKDQSSSAEPILEAALKKAAKEPAYRAAFYQHLLSEDLVAITRKTGDVEERLFIATEDTVMDLLSFADGRVPIFTSTDRIFDKGVMKQQVTYAKFKGEDLLKTLKGKTLLLNPYSDYGKELLPAEVERLLDGTFFTANLKQATYKKETSIAIGQPAVYPTEVVRSLIELFSNRPNVYAAYVGWIYSANTDEQPHYVFAIDSIGEWDDLCQETAFTIKQVMKEDTFFDLMKISNNREGINGYFLNSTQPFYKRA